jgi:hypothetical protein
VDVIVGCCRLGEKGGTAPAAPSGSRGPRGIRQGSVRSPIGLLCLNSPKYARMCLNLPEFAEIGSDTNSSTFSLSHQSRSVHDFYSLHVVEGKRNAVVVGLAPSESIINRFMCVCVCVCV